MSDTVAAEAALAAHAHHGELGFLRTYMFSTDHKMIGRQFLFLGLFMLLIGGTLAMMVRWELAWPETAVPGFNWIPEPYMYEGIIPPQTYNALFTMHATLMIFFVVMPIMVGAFGNFLIPLMIGTRDMAFPKLNMLSFWVGLVAGVVMLSSFLVPGGPAAAGWTSYAPLSARPQYTGVDWGQDLWIISLIILGASSLMGSINYITTIVNMRAPGMTYFRMPLTVWSLVYHGDFAAARPAGLDGRFGDAALRSHGGHELLSSGRRRRAVAVAAYVLVFRPSGSLHSGSSGHGGNVRSALHFFSQADLWLSRHGLFDDRHRFSLVDRLGPSHVRQRYESAARHGVHDDDHGHRGAVGHQGFQLAGHALGRQYSFYLADAVRAWDSSRTFLIGGLSGIFMASTPVDIFIHDTYYIVAHFHYVVAGIIFALFAAVYYWFPKMFGRRMNEPTG